jgi:hypothetical protein
VDFCFANFRGKIIFIGYQKSSIHLTQPVALAAIQLAVNGLRMALVSGLAGPHYLT